MTKEVVLTIPEQVELALDGRTQRWLAFNTRIPETDLSKKMNGKLLFTQDELDKINELLKVKIKI
jgi:hypothetical protein